MQLRLLLLPSYRYVICRINQSLVTRKMRVMILGKNQYHLNEFGDFREEMPAVLLPLVTLPPHKKVLCIKRVIPSTLSKTDM